MHVVCSSMELNPCDFPHFREKRIERYKRKARRQTIHHILTFISVNTTKESILKSKQK